MQERAVSPWGMLLGIQDLILKLPSLCRRDAGDSYVTRVSRDGVPIRSGTVGHTDTLKGCFVMQGAVMRSGKIFGRYVCGAVMALSVFFVPMEAGSAANITKLFLTSGQVDLAREVVRLPLHRGHLASGETVWFVLTDVSDFDTSRKMGLTWAPSLSKAKDLASTRVADMDESYNFTFKSGRVNFSPVQTLKAGEAPNFFPPRFARAGSVGDAHYSPLVRVANRNDIVFNAPMIAFNVGPEKISFCGGNPDYSVVTDSVANICPDNGTVDLKLRFGFADGKHLRYLSFDANSEVSAALEASTVAPAESDILQSGATEVIYTIVNGKTGRNDPERQGLNSALSGEGPSLDILAQFKEVSAGYSPMWDVQLAEWTKEAIEKKNRKLITDGDDLTAKSEAGLLVSPGGGPVRTIGNLVNCPVVGFTNE